MVSESGQLGAGCHDPDLAGTEVDHQGGVVFHADDPAEAVLVVADLVLQLVLLGRRSGSRGFEGTGGQVTPGGGAGRFHHYQYAPQRSSSQRLGAGQ